MGIEALSRGAGHVTFIEGDRRACALIETNLALCGVKQGYTIESGDVTSALRRVRRDAAYDFVLLDPPYDIDPDTVTQVLEVVVSHVTADGLLVLERASRREFVVPDSLRRVRDATSGDSTLTFFSRV